MIGTLIPLMLLTGSALPAGGGAAPATVTTVASPALVLDFPALSIGVAEYDEGLTGATVSKPVMAAVHVHRPVVRPTP
jgi:hypothetical protein